MKLSDLIENENNPRRISKDKLENLEKSLAELGSLDGCVYNRALNRLVTFHQRRKVMLDATITITKEFEQPQKDGTIRLGHVNHNGMLIPYREVSWQKETHELAMLAANNHAGMWDFKKLPDLVLALDAANMNLDLTGFDHDFLEDLMAPDPEKMIKKSESYCPNCRTLLSKT